MFRPENLVYKGQPYEHVVGMGDETVFNACAVVNLDYTVEAVFPPPRLELSTGLSNDLILQPGFAGFSGQDMILTYVHTGGGSIAATTQMYLNGYSAGEGPLAGYSMGTTGNADTAALNLTGDRSVVLGWDPIGGGAFGGLLSEFRLYSGALSDAERQQMTQALGDKYGIATKDIPEPGTACLLLLGLSAIVLARSRRARHLGDQHTALPPPPTAE